MFIVADLVSLNVWGHFTVKQVDYGSYALNV